MTAILISTLIFVLSLFLIFSEKLHRSIVGMAGALLMVGAGKVLNFYNETQAIEAIDFNTLGLLFGMMVLVALLEPTGFFQFLAVWAAQFSRGRSFPLLILLGTITTVLSMFLDNVTTVVLIAPVTILISEVLGVSAVPYLMAEALLSDTGGVATLVGDPPNVLIASAADFTFGDFLTHSLPVIVVAWLVTLMMLRIMFRAELRRPPLDVDAILKLKPSEALMNRKNALRVLVVLLAALLFFFLQDLYGIRPSLVALSAATLALIWIRPPVQEVYQRIEWGVLIFFVALFVMVGGLKASGALSIVISLFEQAVHIPPMWMGVLMIWLVAVLSAVVDNVPITIALIPIIQGLGANGFNVTALWWALVFGAGLGGNGTIIGSSANIIVATISERTRTPITSRLWSQRGLPVMLVTCAIASIAFILVFPLFER